MLRSTPARTGRRDAVAAAVTVVEGMTPTQLATFLDELAGLPSVESVGWRVCERRLSGERFQARNDEIERLHQRGLKSGQIGKKLGMTRGAVKQVLRRRRQKSGYAKTMYPSSCEYAGNRRTSRP
jgi:hypothetical protein